MPIEEIKPEEVISEENLIIADEEPATETEEVSTTVEEATEEHSA